MNSSPIGSAAIAATSLLQWFAVIALGRYVQRFSDNVDSISPDG